MTALLAALERDPGAAYRRAAALALTAAVTAFAGWMAAGSTNHRCSSAPTRRPSSRACGTPAARQPCARPWGRSARPRPKRQLATVMPRIDRYAASRVEMRNEACVAHAEARQSTPLFDLRTACLAQRRAGLDALVAALLQADAGSVDDVVQATAELPPLDRCADAQALTADVPPPEDPRLRLRVQAHREALARAGVREDAGQYQLGRALVEDVLADSSSLVYEPLRAEALLRAGSLAMEAGDHATAERAYDDALLAGLGTGHAVVAAVASSKQIYLRAVPLNQSPRARAEVPLATALNQRVRHDVDLYSSSSTTAGSCTRWRAS